LLDGQVIKEILAVDYGGIRAAKLPETMTLLVRRDLAFKNRRC
jgi:hypothetical protein